MSTKFIFHVAGAFWLALSVCCTRIKSHDHWEAFNLCCRSIWYKQIHSTMERSIRGQLYEIELTTDDFDCSRSDTITDLYVYQIAQPTSISQRAIIDNVQYIKTTLCTTNRYGNRRWENMIWQPKTRCQKSLLIIW